MDIREKTAELNYEAEYNRLKEEMAAFVEVAIVAIHNICVEHQIYGKWKKYLISELEPEIKNILKIKEYMSAEDIGDLVVGHAERLRKEAEKAREDINEQ